MLPWQPLLTGCFFRILNFHLFIENYNFSEVSFTFLYHSRVFLLISVTLWSILAIFKGSGKIKKSKMVDPRWTPFYNLT